MQVPDALSRCMNSDASDVISSPKGDEGIGNAIISTFQTYFNWNPIQNKHFVEMGNFQRALITMELSNSRLTTNEDILNEFDPYSSRSSDQSFMENNFEIDCNFESQNLCKTNCKSKPQEYENSKNTYIGIAINSVSV
jgi:hypothetical protein